MNKADCLTRLYILNPTILHSIMEFLENEHIINDTDIYKYKLAKNKPEYVYEVFKKIKNKLQTLTFQWTILPTEYIIISIATDNEYKEFVYGR